MRSNKFLTTHFSVFRGGLPDDSYNQVRTPYSATLHIWGMYGENHPESVVTSTNDGSCTSGSTSTVLVTMLVLVLAPVLVLVPVQVLVVAVGLGRH